VRLNATEGRPISAFTCIDPFPRPWLRTSSEVRVVAKPAQEVPVDVFLTPSQNDLLFIDSTHTVKTASDVNHLILEVLPRLSRGVIVHFHDIFFPYDYSRDVLDTFVHWSETSLLRAFLCHNAKARIMLSLSMLHYERPNVLKTHFPEYNPEPDSDGLRCGSARPMESSTKEHFPSSTYIRIF
jgi:hypothetical protein